MWNWIFTIIIASITPIVLITESAEAKTTLILFQLGLLIAQILFNIFRD